MKNERETAMKSQNSEKSDGCQPQILRYFLRKCPYTHKQSNHHHNHHNHHHHPPPYRLCFLGKCVGVWGGGCAYWGWVCECLLWVGVVGGCLQFYVVKWWWACLKRVAVVVVWMAVGWKKAKFGLGMVGEVLALQKNKNKYSSPGQDSIFSTHSLLTPIFRKMNKQPPPSSFHVSPPPRHPPHPPPHTHPLTDPPDAQWSMLTERGWCLLCFFVYRWCQEEVTLLMRVICWWFLVQKELC